MVSVISAIAFLTAVLSIACTSARPVTAQEQARSIDSIFIVQEHEIVLNWGPSLIGGMLNRLVNVDSDGNEKSSMGELLQTIGQELQPIAAPGFWKDFGHAFLATFTAVATVVPAMFEAVIKFIRD